MNRLGLSIIAMLVAGSAAHAATQPAPAVSVKVTQSHLVPVCVDGQPSGDKRAWTMAAGDHTMAFTMRNEPRSGTGAEGAGSPGVATVSFSLEAGHRYEVEVRAGVETFSRRIWEREQWIPVVRNRTTDRIVSGEPRWSGKDCQP